MRVTANWLQLGIIVIYIWGRDRGEGCININMTINRTEALMSSHLVSPPAVFWAFLCKKKKLVSSSAVESPVLEWTFLAVHGSEFHRCCPWCWNSRCSELAYSRHYKTTYSVCWAATPHVYVLLALPIRIIRSCNHYRITLYCLQM